MWRLAPTLTREMGQAYPELAPRRAIDQETLKLEETRFRTTLARGLSILEDETAGRSSPATNWRARPPSSSTTPMASRST
jgi:alanyl-tRNA synthetase